MEHDSHAYCFSNFARLEFTFLPISFACLLIKKASDKLDNLADLVDRQRISSPLDAGTLTIFFASRGDFALQFHSQI